MKLAVVGSRSINDYVWIESVLESLMKEEDVTELVSGGAAGVDSLARRFAEEHSLGFTEILPDWQRYGKIAGFIRNKLIVDYCDLLLAFWNGKSSGTANSIKLAEKQHKLKRILMTNVRTTT